MPRSGNSTRTVANKTPGPWKAWRKTTRHGRAIRFVEKYLRSPKGTGHGSPIKLAEWQKNWIEEILAPGISMAVMSMPRGNGKSTLSAAMAVWALFDDDSSGSPSVPIVATTLGQAIKSTYLPATLMVRAEPELADRSIEFTGITTPRVYTPFNEGLLYPLSNDVDGLQGLDANWIACDEIGFQESEVWSSLVLAAGKRDQSLVWGMGTPGLDRSKSVLWAIREKVMGGAEIPGLAWREYAADENSPIDDRDQWRKANPALVSGFLREEALVSALAMVPASHFRVFREGIWEEGTDSWLGADGNSIWRKSEDAYQLVEGAPSWVGVDVGLRQDSSAICTVQYRPDGRMHAETKIWMPKADQPVDVTELMGYLRTLCDKYKVGAIAYDPRLFELPSIALTDEGLPMVELNQSVERMTPIIGELYKAVMNGEITHNRDPQFTQQVLNAVPRLNERGFTLSKGKSRGKIDAAIALALAHDRASHKKKARSLYIG